MRTYIMRTTCVRFGNYSISREHYIIIYTVQYRAGADLPLIITVAFSEPYFTVYRARSFSGSAIHDAYKQPSRNGREHSFSSVSSGFR